MLMAGRVASLKARFAEKENVVRDLSASNCAQRWLKRAVAKELRDETPC